MDSARWNEKNWYLPQSKYAALNLIEVGRISSLNG